MGGWLGIGGSSAKTDRGAQLGARQGEWNIFNSGMATGNAQEQTGQQNLGDASQYFRNLLQGGRTQTAQLAEPSIKAATGQADAARTQEAETGTSRTGGAAAADASASTATRSKIDDIINTTLMGGREEGAKGLTQIGGIDLNNAMAQLGLAQGSASDIMNNATESRKLSNQINLQTQEQWGQLAGVLASLAFLKGTICQDFSRALWAEIQTLLRAARC